MKKIFCCIAFLLLTFIAAFSQVLNDMQIINGKHWIYEDFKTLSGELCLGTFATNTPITVGELRLYFKQFDREQLSESGKIVYDRDLEFLQASSSLFKDKPYRASFGLKLAPELWLNSNEQIERTFDYYYKDNPVNLIADAGIGNNFALGMQLFAGKNYRESNNIKSFTNIPLNYSQLEFTYPRFTYGSVGLVYNDWGLNLTAGKEGLTIGNTKTGSVIYNSTFETDTYIQLNFFTNSFKYSLETIQVEPEKFLYLHQFEIRFFEKIKFGAIEGALINKPFEIRFLNPIMVFHSYAFWKQYADNAMNHFYNEGLACAYLGITLEANPIKNLRLYALYAMNEMQVPPMETGKWLSYPDSFAIQAGAEYKLPSSFGGYWNANFETVYCAPFVYIKQAPDWSLYRHRWDQITYSYVDSWIGSPFGPDSLVFDTGFGYDQTGKWSVSLGYRLSFKGQNDFGLFNKANYKKLQYEENGADKDAEVWTYYPYTEYVIADDKNDEAGRQAALKKGRNMWMTGICQTNHQISLEGSYTITKALKVSGKFVYTLSQNARHVSGNLQHGVEGDLSVEWRVF